MSGILYLVPSSLGESGVETILPAEVCRIAAGLDYFIVENAKTARAFLKRVAGTAPLARPLQDIEMRELKVSTAPSLWPQLLGPLREGRDAGLVSEAGCPAVADPGAGLVALAHAEGLKIRPLVGPSSILLALMASGLNGQRFAFEGYLPTDPPGRLDSIASLEARSRLLAQTQIVIETPYRNMVLFEALCQHLAPATRLCVATDLTLATEEVRTLPAARWRTTAVQLQRRPTIFLFLA